ncbi:hypothetical protein L1049_026613 [Liquidambar formosana]|uniref:Uncharacterized protein n=1 Tax=Liquidambar formosana TaxID=63359 RepID=A0AAP0NFV8_LIQFO
MEQEGHDWELLREKMKEDLKLNSNTSFTVTELAEKIDDLVDKVITLETAVSSQTALVNGLRSETDKLQAHIRILEEEKGALIDGSDNTSNKLRLLEEELHRVKNLNQSVEDKNNHLQTHFTEVTCNLDHLSVKLESVKPAEEVNSSTGLFQEVEAVTEAKPEMKFEEHEDKLPPGTISESSKDVKTEEEEKDEAQDLSNPVLAEEEKDNFVQSNQRNYNLDVLSEECQGPKQQKKDEKQELSQTVDNDVDIEPQEAGIWEDQPDLRQLFLNGSEDREKHLLEQYTTILRNFKEVKKKLCEAEKKNRDNLFESAMQIKELKNANALKDKEILSLRKKLWGLPPSNPDENLDNSLKEYAHSLQGGHEHRESIPGAASFRFSNNSFQNTEQQPVSNLSDEHNVEPTEKAEESTSFRFSNILYQNTEGQPVFNFSDEHNVKPTEKAEESTTQRSTDSPTKVVENGIKAIPVDESHAVSSIEEKFRADIDDLLEENLEFWLRFSTSFHQIQKFQTSIQDLQAELSKLKKNKKQDGSSKHQSLKSDARPIYAHLREIQTELTLWIEHNAVLKDELQSRFSSLCNIQEEISRISSAGSKAAETELNNYQAAKFQGEVLNMKQENNKVADELKAGLNCVESLQVEVEKTMEKMDEDFGFSESKSHHHHVPKRNPLNRSRIPLRSFLFGAKLKRQKPLLFSCMNPALQKQYSDLTSGLPP